MGSATGPHDDDCLPRTSQKDYSPKSRRGQLLNAWKSTLTYQRLPKEPLNLSILKLDGSCFGIYTFSHSILLCIYIYMCMNCVILHACMQAGTYMYIEMHAYILIVVNVQDIYIYIYMHKFVNLDVITYRKILINVKQGCKLGGRQQ